MEEKDKLLRTHANNRRLLMEELQSFVVSDQFLLWGGCILVKYGDGEQQNRFGVSYHQVL